MISWIDFFPKDYYRRIGSKIRMYFNVPMEEYAKFFSFIGVNVKAILSYLIHLLKILSKCSIMV